MKKLLYPLLIAATFLTAVSCGERHNITGHIAAPDDRIIVFAANWDGDPEVDTIPVNNGKFAYDIPELMSDPVFVYMIRKSDVCPRLGGGSYHPASRCITLLLTKNDHVRIKGKNTATGMEYSVGGSELNNAIARHNKESLPLLSRMDSLEIEIDKACYMPGAENDEEYISRLFEERIGYSGRIREVTKTYIRSNPAAELSALYVTRNVEFDSLEYYLAALEPAATEGRMKPLIDALKKRQKEYMENQRQQEVVKTGNDAPAFSLTDRNGKAVSLGDIGSEYVVLDFWGSWCGWCIAGFPKMKEYYAKYKDRVEIVGIDCRDKHEEWIAALDKYELPWMQLIEDPDDKISAKYAVGGYPTKIILGPDRKIVSIFVGESEEFYRKLDELLK